MVAKFFREIDWYLLAPILGLLCIGFLALYSSALTEENLNILWKQCVILIIGSGIFVLLSKQNYHEISKISRWLYIFSILLLVLTFVIGPEIRGAHRWVDLGPLRLQTSEIAKIAVLLGVSRWLWLERGSINTLGILFRTATLTFIPAGLVLIQPDLGSALIILSIWAGLLIVSRARLRILVAIGLLGVIAAGLAWQYGLHDFQRNRLLVFINPKADTSGQGYNVRQAVIAVGSGKWLGQGLGKGSQSQLDFLPENRTDFVFAAIAEELGLVGASIVIVLYMAFLWRIWQIAKNSPDDLSAYYALGVWWWFFVQGSINIGMNMSLLPVTGLPLPFVSHGGSSLFISAAAIGILQNISKNQRGKLKL